MIRQVNSGYQNGVDIAGIIAAKEKGIKTGGVMPKGFRTLDGPKPQYAELYGAKEHESSSYVPRTYENVRDADGTIRIAFDFNSAGEKCTLKAIKQYNKPYFNVLVKDPTSLSSLSGQTTKDAYDWIIDNRIDVLNVAGNSTKTCFGIQKWAYEYLKKLFGLLEVPDYPTSSSVSSSKSSSSSSLGKNITD